MFNKKSIDTQIAVANAVELAGLVAVRLLGNDLATTIDGKTIDIATVTEMALLSIQRNTVNKLGVV